MTAKTAKKNIKSMALSAKPAFKPGLKSQENPSKHRPTGPGKTFQKDGHWIENPHKAAVLVCECGNKYLKTRDRQSKCLRCLSQGK